ncbi:S8 family peptidase [Blastococcus sp. TF02A-35]|uniref:S8 family peptidase n=1 Tax=Blastococcus sp. TF02A-35 TaxID=2559612 RepID=UPI001073CB2E|nr:S8 family peptidase [Blastococcus sp. TF02A_35]TFV48900.1 hypothetical protein E4P43_13210 [Blastococcus sp. TF02A_35]
MDRSVATIKADAARRSFQADGAGIVWAVIDSGIDGAHLHFREHDTLGGSVAELHRDFSAVHADPAESAAAALRDGYGHGSHVAGVIAGELPRAAWAEAKLRVTERVRDVSTGDIVHEDRSLDGIPALAGVAPRCKLVSLRVLDDKGAGLTSAIIEALRYVRQVNVGGKGLRIHGVNLSLGYEFDAQWFACGQSPFCVEVNELVRSGVVVVAAAGNTGYGRVAARTRSTSTGMALTINDPGNAELAITVGATHRDQPYTYGVSYFSSKGPTGDGRQKPDVVAPGEKITSCAAGAALARLGDLGPDGARAVYLDDDGTSMAAPHVSGAAAAFLSVKREFIADPARVKQVFRDTASSLGRVPDFQGAGLVDLMRAISSV